MLFQCCLLQIKHLTPNAQVYANGFLFGQGSGSNTYQFGTELMWYQYLSSSFMDVIAIEITALGGGPASFMFAPFGSSRYAIDASDNPKKWRCKSFGAEDPPVNWKVNDFDDGTWPFPASYGAAGSSSDRKSPFHSAAARLYNRHQLWTSGSCAHPKNAEVGETIYCRAHFSNIPQSGVCPEPSQSGACETECTNIVPPAPAPTSAPTPTPPAVKPECEYNTNPQCFKSQYHLAETWPQVAKCLANSRANCLPVPQSIYKDLFRHACGGFCQTSAYRTDMCSDSSLVLPKVPGTPTCCTNGKLPDSTNKCVQQTTAQCAAEASHLGCASMYGMDYRYGQCAIPTAKFQHWNGIGVPIAVRKSMRIAVNSLSSDGKPAPSSFKVVIACSSS
jgi:hypothetical protein